MIAFLNYKLGQGTVVKTHILGIAKLMDSAIRSVHCIRIQFMDLSCAILVRVTAKAVSMAHFVQLAQQEWLLVITAVSAITSHIFTVELAMAAITPV
jgi:hypothetical protein